MASATIGIDGLVFLFDHDEVTKVIEGTLGAGVSIGTIVSAACAAGVITLPLALVTGIITAYFGGEAWLIRNVDIGGGIKLTIPLPALALGQWEAIIPSSRPLHGPGPIGDGRWSDRNNGELYTEDDADLIVWTIDRNAVDPQTVMFRLEIDPATSGWDKVINMPDGEGASWDIVATGRGGSAENSLWAPQVNNGQVLTFRKAGFLNRRTNVITLGDLNGLMPGDRATFRWMRDTR